MCVLAGEKGQRNICMSKPICEGNGKEGEQNWIKSVAALARNDENKAIRADRITRLTLLIGFWQGFLRNPVCGNTHSNRLLNHVVNMREI